ncbi:MAG: TonB family protein [Thermoanaerobaculia bacterium]
MPRLWPVALGGVIVVIGLALVGGTRTRRDRRVEPEEAPARVTLDRAALRRKPDDRSPALRNLEQGAEVKVLEDRGGWLEVDAGGEKGFLAADAVERERDREAREKRAKSILAYPPVFGVVAEETDVVLAPFPVAPRAGRLRPGEVIPIHSVDHAYFAFRTREGELAFVSSADVDLVPRDPTRPEIVPDQRAALKRLTIRDLEASGPAMPEEFGEPGEEFPPSLPGEEPFEEPEGGEVLEHAVLLSKVSPVYPEAARRLGIEGTVVLEVAIDASGRVREVEVVRGLPYGLSEAAVEAVRRWQYRAARGPSGPVSSRKMVRILYSLGR